MSRRNTRVAFSNVLLATDFSSEAVRAVPCARGLCHRHDAKLHVVHVMDLFPFALSADPAAIAQIEQIRYTADAQMKEFLRANHLDEDKFESALITGETLTAIEEFIREHAIDLVVLGSRGDVGLNRLFEGSMAEEIFRSVHCPVMIVGPKAKVRADTAMFNHLLFPTDLSRFSKTAIPYIEFLLGEAPSAKVTLAHFFGEECTNVCEQHELRRRRERELREMLAPGLVDQIEDVVVESCTPSEGMLKIAEGVAADLLVLGVRAGGAFTRAATHGLCSVAPRVISESPCPVLTIRAV